jgi:hypothetical protein
VERNNSKNEKTLSRQEFLKAITSGLVLFGLGRTATRLMDIVGRGEQEAFLAFLKFEAVVPYALSQRWPLVVKTSQHFLEASGSDLEISSDLIRSLRTSGKDNKIKTSSLLNNFFGPLISESISQGLVTSRKWNGENIANGNEFRFIGEVSCPNLPDINYSLGRFAVGVMGMATNPQRNGNMLDFLFSGETYIKDRYDFGTNDKTIRGVAYPNTTVVLFLRQMGITKPLEFLTRKLGSNLAKNILNSSLGQFTTSDGRLLQDTGWGVPYTIFTKNFQVRTPVTVVIP